MHLVMLDNIPTLAEQSLPPALLRLAPEGTRRASWLAGRVLLSRILSPLPEIVYSDQGKPGFGNEVPLWFNISHSGDEIALLISDEGEVGCDIEVIRPRKNWQRLARMLFSASEYRALEAEPQAQQLTAFWHIWCRKEAMLKRSGSTVWQMADIDSTAPGNVFMNQFLIDNTLTLALCTSTPYLCASTDLIRYGKAVRSL